MAALRLCGFAALRLERFMAALRLCGFDAFQGARVYPNPRAMYLAIYLSIYLAI